MRTSVPVTLYTGKEKELPCVWSYWSQQYVQDFGVGGIEFHADIQNLPSLFPP